LIDEFCEEDGPCKFSDSEDKDERKGKVDLNKEETKVITRTECKKAGVVPPPVSGAACPEVPKPRSVVPKPTSRKTPKPNSATKTSETANTKTQSKSVDAKQTPKIRVLVAADTTLKTQDPGHQPGSVVAIKKADSTEQTSAKSFATIVLPTRPPQQVGPKIQIPTNSPPKSTTTSALPMSPDFVTGKAPMKLKQVTVSQKTVDASKQIKAKAKQANKMDSPTVKKPFDQATKPTKTAERIVQTPDGEGHLQHPNLPIIGYA